MKILFLTHVGAPGGAEFMMIKLCEAFRSNSEVLHFQHGPLESMLQERSIPSSVYPMPKEISDFRRENGLRSLLKVIPATLSVIRAIADRCRSYDVIVCMSQKSFILASLAKPFARKPIIWFMNDIISTEHFSRTLILLLTRAFRFTPDHIILNSQASLMAWKQAGGREHNVHVIYPGTDFAFIERALGDRTNITELKKQFSPDGKPLVGLFGRLTSWKGQDVFLKALSSLHDVRGVIVGGALFGEEAYEEKLKELTRELGIADRVTFAGHLDDVPKVMAACDVVVHCSTAPEPFGLVIVEAMMVGTPVIASAAGGAREIVVHGETGLLTPPGDENTLASAIRSNLDQPIRSATMSGKAKERAIQKFSHIKMIASFSSILDDY